MSFKYFLAKCRLRWGWDLSNTISSNISFNLIFSSKLMSSSHCNARLDQYFDSLQRACFKSSFYGKSSPSFSLVGWGEHSKIGKENQKSSLVLRGRILLLDMTTHCPSFNKQIPFPFLMVSFFHYYSFFHLWCLTSIPYSFIWLTNLSRSSNVQRSP